MTKTKMLRPGQVAERVGLSIRQLYRLEAAGQFPAKITLGEHSAAWCERDVEAWLLKRIQAAKQRRAAKHNPEPQGSTTAHRPEARPSP